MPDVTQNVLIDFQVDYTQLTTATEQLAKAGKIDTKGFEGIQTAINTTATDTKGLIAQFKTVATSATKMGKSVENAFGAGIQDALDEAGVSVKEFGDALVKANTPTKRLKTEMLELKEALARMKAEGKDTGKEFEALRARAGKLQDAISDANLEIKNAGSDTRGLDNVVGSISAVAGGFAAVQGAAALFGDENKDLQKTLVRVNASMALATGIQQFYNATLKEGSLAKLKDSIVSGTQTAAMQLYTFVTGGATVATKLFRAALIATGIGAIIFLVVQFVGAMDSVSSSTKAATLSTEDFNDALQKEADLFERLGNNIKFAGDMREQSLRKQGASEAEIFKNSIKTQQQELENLQKQRDKKEQALIDNAAATAEVQAGIDSKAKRRRDNTSRGDLIDQKKTLEEQRQTIEQGYNEISKTIIQKSQAITLSVASNDADAAVKARERQKKFLEERLKAILEARKKAEAEDLKNTKEGFARILKGFQDEEDQLRIHLENLADIKERDRAADQKLEEEWEKLRLERIKDLQQFGEDAAKAAIKAEEDLMAKRIANAEELISIASKIGDFYSQISASQTQFDNERIKARRAEIADLLEAGAITQKEAAARNKQLEALEKQARQRAAQREKNAALFQAALAIPKAFLEGLVKGGPPLAAIYAALAAIQAALIASKPIPKFFRGKRDRYEGPGEVADMGSELVERNGRMFLYTKPTQTYLGAMDKVYTAAQTREMLHNTDTRRLIVNNTTNGMQIDYAKMGAAIPKSAISINIDKDFIKESVAEGLMTTNYKARRYRWQ